MRSSQGAAVKAAPDLPSRRAGSIIEAGANCWRVDRADRFYCIQDGAEYFRLVRQALLSARHSVLVLGWDIAGGLNLLPDRPPEEAGTDSAPVQFDELLAYIVGRNRRLRCDILIWDYASLYTLERDPFSRIRLGWRTPRRVRFGYDDRHPIGGSHHQKIVVIDDRLAFCGSIDITTHRWDTTAHRVEEPARTSRFGKPYGPYHEVQAMVEGPVARSLGDLARERWRALGDSKIAAPPARSESLWPEGIEPDLTGVSVGIARTMPGGGDHPAAHEVEQLFIDSINAARRSIYIESQYFTSAEIGRALARRLAEDDGPEVVVVTSRECSGWLEQKTMGVLRQSVFQHLKSADRNHRLRLVFPFASRAADVPTFIHSKVMIVDDTFLRIGSANCAHRSLGLDTECDLAADASGDREAEQGIRRVRDRLLAEHLGRDAAEVSDALARAPMRDLIDRHHDGERTLALIEVAEADGSTPPAEGIIAAADPTEPLGFGPAVERVMPWVDASAGGNALRLWILPGIALAAALVAAWTATGDLRRPEFQQLQQVLIRASADPALIAIGAACFVMAAALLVPAELLILSAGIAFGFASGSLVAFAGSIVAACLGYVAGRALGESGLTKWMSQRSYRTTRQARLRGPLAIALFRVTASAGAGAIHLASGARRLPFRDYLIGTVLALLPVVPAVAALGAMFRHLILHPSVWNSIITMAASFALIAVAGLVRMAVLIRQFRPAAATHQSRAEFG